VKEFQRYGVCLDPTKKSTVLDGIGNHFLDHAIELALLPPGRPAIHAPSQPDQPASHACPVPDPAEPLCGVKVPCIGDQLTRVRFAGAKDLCAGAHTSKDRLDHLYPFRCAAWHTKRSFLKVHSEIIYCGT